jgi:hypothetical protein
MELGRFWAVSCEIRHKATTDSEIIRPLIPRNSSSDSDINSTIFGREIGIGGRITLENWNRWSDKVGMCCHYRMLRFFLLVNLLQPHANGLSLGSIRKLLFKEVCFVTKEDTHA